MTTRTHLVHHLQDIYSFVRDFLPLLREMEHASKDERLHRLLRADHDAMQNGMETIERALNLLGARYKMERSPMVAALREETERFKHQMNPTPEHMEIHHLLGALKVAQITSSAYQGEIELARAIGEQDVATLLEENLQREAQSIATLRDLLPRLATEISRSESRQAA